MTRAPSLGERYRLRCVLPHPFTRHFIVWYCLMTWLLSAQHLSQIADHTGKSSASQVNPGAPAACFHRLAATRFWSPSLGQLSRLGQEAPQVRSSDWTLTRPQDCRPAGRNAYTNSSASSSTVSSLTPFKHRRRRSGSQRSGDRSATMKQNSGSGTPKPSRRWKCA